jgi:hypothetical protein
MIRRRDIITLLGGAAAWPFAARAQQATMPVIGLLDQRSPEALADRVGGFRQGLRDVGFVNGQNAARISERNPRRRSLSHGGDGCEPRRATSSFYGLWASCVGEFCWSP